jgi:hypothetical protein
MVFVFKSGGVPCWERISVLPSEAVAEVSAKIRNRRLHTGPTSVHASCYKAYNEFCELDAQVKKGWTHFLHFLAVIPLLIRIIS